MKLSLVGSIYVKIENKLEWNELSNSNNIKPNQIKNIFHEFTLQSKLT